MLKALIQQPGPMLLCLCVCQHTQGFEEGRIRFPPTFKFVPGSSAYSDKRVPSWTDRILWKVRCGPRQQQQQQEEVLGNTTTTTTAGGGGGGWGWGGDDDAALLLPPPSVTQLYYTSIPEVTSSDHKPVISGFDVAVEAAEGEVEGEVAGEAEVQGEEGEGEDASTRCHCYCVMM